MPDKYVENVAKIFRELEGELLEILVKRLKEGSDTGLGVTEWQFQKLKDLDLLRPEVYKAVAERAQVAEEEVEESFTKGYKEVTDQVDRAAIASGKTIGKPSSTTDQIVQGYLRQAQNEFDFTGGSMSFSNLGFGDSITKYRDVVNRTTAFVTTGMFTLEEGVQRASHEILTAGLKTTFRDRARRQIPVDSYIRSVMKTTLAKTFDEVRKEHMEEYGMHHVVVGSLVGAREACSKIQGQVVDLRHPEDIPEDSEFKSIWDDSWEAQYKEPGGHHGINCRHPHFPFVPGVNTNNQPEYSDELNEQVASNQQKQRSLERQIRQYKKHLKVAQEFGNEEDIQRYSKLIRGRQAAVRELVESNKHLTRDYLRERPFDFSITPKKIVEPPVIVEKEVVATKREMPTEVDTSIKTLEEIEYTVMEQEERYIYEFDVYEETAEAFNEVMTELIDEHDFAMRIPSVNILKEISETHFKNQMETGSSAGALNFEMRKDAVSNMFGLDKSQVNKLKNKEFEKYGYLAHKDLKIDTLKAESAKQYGGITVRFNKESIADRTTYTVGDSLYMSEESGGVAASVLKPSLAGVDEWLLQDNFIEEAGEEFVEDLRGATGDVELFLQKVQKPYVELQFHGDLTIDDVESISVAKFSLEERKLTPEIRQMLKDKGIQLNIVEE